MRSPLRSGRQARVLKRPAPHRRSRFGGSSAVPITYTIRGQVHDIGTPRNASYPHSFSARYAYTQGGNVSTAEFYQKQSPHAFKGYRYAFSYDGFNRMTAADFSRWSSGRSFFGSSYFDVSNITYDAAGNIRTLQRRGASTAIADNLTYNYAGFNRLTGITDAAGANQEWDSGTMSFQYDANGNMTSIQDVSRSSTWSLTYDESNRVISIEEPGTTAFRYRYRYNADGQRYHKQAVPYAAAPGPAHYYALDGNTTVGFFPLTGLGTEIDRREIHDAKGSTHPHPFRRGGRPYDDDELGELLPQGPPRQHA